MTSWFKNNNHLFFIMDRLYKIGITDGTRNFFLGRNPGC